MAESEDGELLCHEGMSLAAAGDAVGHSGQAVTMPAARGQHLFTRTKRFLMDWATEQGLAGMYSEATAAHPYSQRANIELGAHETGFLLGWIPASVSNDAAAESRRGRQSAALFYTKLNDGHERPVYAPERHREIVGQTLRAVRAARNAGRAAGGRRAGRADRAARRGRRRPQPGADHRARPGCRPRGRGRRRASPPLPPRLASTRSTSTCRWSTRPPPSSPTTSSALGVSYSGVFPNSRCDGDVLRMQSLHRARIKADDVAVASEHGRELLDYVLADLP